MTTVKLLNNNFKNSVDRRNRGIYISISADRVSMKCFVKCVHTCSVGNYGNIGDAELFQCHCFTAYFKHFYNNFVWFRIKKIKPLLGPR